MCGIAGLISRDGAAPAGATLDALARALAHRGPDGQGRHVAGGVGLVHARLAIIDLATGDQPLFEPGGGALVGNGEIYNYIELRAAMATTNFRTRSDCEPPLLLHRHEGIGFARHLRGMYALAIHDAPSGRLTLSRDPFGIKPLYLAETPSGLAFASEPRALIAAGLVAPKARAGKARELLQLQFTTGAATIFEGIDRLLPGETVAIERGAIIERRRRAALPEGGPRDITEDAALAELDRVLVDSVAVHQRSDVPYGLFLSGGIDSATLLAIMARLNDRPVRAFTAAFPETAARDERALARTLARKVGAEHVEVEVREADFWAHLPAIAAAMDDPAADYAIVPTWLLAREAAKSLKVVLSGEGGDEIFGGYGRYRAAMRPRWLGGRAMRRKGALDGLGLLRDDAGWRAGFEVSESEAALSGRTRLQIAQAVDCADWLPNDLLIKLDRCLMAHALEGRTPFLDPVVADFAFRLPDGLKVQNGLGKHLLRLWLSRHLPEAEPFSKKRGFTVPVGEWITKRGAALGEAVARQAGIAELCQPDAVRALYRSDLASDGRRGFAAWTLLFYALWHRRHIEGREAEGDVAHMLH